MLTKQEYLLICLAEECSEISQRVTKALRFGLNEVQPGQDKTNHTRLVDEITDLIGVLDALDINGLDLIIQDEAVEAKKVKIENYYQYAKECRTVK